MREDCIQFVGAISSVDGYGRTHDKQNNWKTVTAHRFAWSQVHGPIPDGMCILHKCDNRSCINIEHLELGTQKENVRQCMERGRRYSMAGANNSQAKLNDEKVREIRDLHDNGVRIDTIAKEFGISKATVHTVTSGRKWTHVK